MPAASAALAGHKPTARSRVTNGSDLLPGIDGRSVTARRYRDILAALASDMGGVEHMSEARAQLARRFAALAVQAEALEARLARGEDIDLQDHALISSTLVRLASRLGIERTARDVTSLSAYLAAAHPTEFPDSEIDQGAPRVRGRERLTGEAASGEAEP